MKEQFATMEREYETLGEAIHEDTRQIKAVNEEIHYLGQYLANKKIYMEFLNSPDKGACRLAHQSQIDAYEQATAFLNTRFEGGKFPTLDKLKATMKKLLNDQKH